MKRVMLIAFHYPPAKGSSGIQRTLSFSRYLRENGWEPIVVTAHARAYPQQSDEQLSEVPDDIIVERAFALDTSRHLAIRGRYLALLAYPDRWVTWAIGGVATAVRLVAKYRPSVIWSTFPIATAHLIGLAVHRLTSVPWVADFRDSMTEDEYPTDPRKRRIYRWIEERTVAGAARSIFTAPGAVEMYASRYPEISRSRLQVILNGYDELIFDKVAALSRDDDRVADEKKVVLVHSGLLYPSERDPTSFLAAVRHLLDEAHSGIHNVEIRLRASGFEDYLRSRIEAVGIGSIVKLMPAVGYDQALSEMIHADGLLIFQASNCNHQIPAKLYEYIRARRPILALTDPSGDTAGLLRSCGVSTVVPLDSKEMIVAGLRDFLTMIAHGSAPVANDEVIAEYSRRSQTRRLAELFDAVSGEQGDTER